jgi:hypothetical protein
MSNITHDIWCFIEGDEEPFFITPSSTTIVARLKDMIKDEKSRVLQRVDSQELTLWKVPLTVISLAPTINFAERMEAWFTGADLPEYAEKLELHYTVAAILQSRNQTLTSLQLDIYVRLPAPGKWQDVNSHNHSATLELLLPFPLSYTSNPFHPITTCRF